ncbi:GerW family sporulation protein [Capillibacterium thermochitinicola]|uniref:GerW family sporulation protein n=1 Tax=Capillibacterium thermochitinicola TaxID=2699427 RepID=A0A8J6I408_9FIRM|nr:GerW family sporulation protein [Capillibacterium thermochitinicola]MBA2133822.1 GerW family sporulation protein [Capillibacterium thermochitinicola]
MQGHPIEGLMKTAMESIKDMVDVNTILGDPVETPDGSVIIPVSRVSFGFAAGGSEFAGQQKADQRNQETDQAVLPFGGGSGAGITLNPVAFLVVNKEQTRLLPVDNNVLVDRLLDVAPQIIDKFQNMMDKPKTKKVEEVTVTQ